MTCWTLRLDKQEVKLRAHSFVGFEHARLRKSTVNIDVAGKRAQGSVENWILLVFISRLGWHLRVQRNHEGRCDRNKKLFLHILFLHVREFSRKVVAASPWALQRILENFMSQTWLPRKCFSMRFENNISWDKETFLWLPLERKFISIQYLGERNLLKVFCNWRFAALINFPFSPNVECFIEV